MTDIVKQLRAIASRGRMDDADVQIIFDAADKLQNLEVFENYFWKFCPDPEAYRDDCPWLFDD